MNSTQLQPGPELDRLLCEALGIDATHWRFRHPGGVQIKSRYRTRLEAEQELKKTWGEKMNELRSKLSVEPVPDSYPPVSTDGNAMLRLIEAMREREWHAEIGGNYRVVLRCHCDPGYACAVANHRTLPGAVALASAFALGVQMEAPKK